MRETSTCTQEYNHDRSAVQWPQRISNDVLYARCATERLSHIIKQARWKLFGHIPRLSSDKLAMMAMEPYFSLTALGGWRGQPRTCNLADEIWMPTSTAHRWNGSRQPHISAKSNKLSTTDCAGKKCAPESASSKPICTNMKFFWGDRRRH